MSRVLCICDSPLQNREFLSEVERIADGDCECCAYVEAFDARSEKGFELIIMKLDSLDGDAFVRVGAIRRRFMEVQILCAFEGNVGSLHYDNVAQAGENRAELVPIQGASPWDELERVAMKWLGLIAS